MKMGLIITDFIYFILTGLLLAGCIGSPTNKADLVKSRQDGIIQKEKQAIAKNFNIVCKAMLRGDIETVYQKYLSSSLQNLSSYDEFVKDYNLNKENYLVLFKGAVLKQISPENDLASVIVVWGNGEGEIIEFSKENNIWKIRSLIQPPEVYPIR
jgi:hypothetical protein